MITFIFGPNHYQTKQALDRIIKQFDQAELIERFEGEAIEATNIKNILGNVSLFTQKRLVVIRDAHQNKALWAELAELAAEVPDEVHVVLLETIPDKRTKTFKLLQKTAEVVECNSLSEIEAITWLRSQAELKQLPIDQKMAKLIVQRVGVDQWQLFHTLEKIEHADELSLDTIINITVATPQASTFELIDAALASNPEKVRLRVQLVSGNEDPYFFFGLLSSQLFQLISLKVSDKSPGEVANDLSVHPYPLQKMKPTVMTLASGDVKLITEALAVCDDQLKRSSIEPWHALEQALVKIATR